MVKLGKFPNQSNTNIFKDLNIRYSNMNTQFSGYEYIWYSYSANLLRTNIFGFGFSLVVNNEYIRIQSAVRIWMYSIFEFGKIFYKYVLIYKKSLGTCIIMHQNLFKIYFLMSSKVCILYIQYSYSAKFLRLNIFDIRIRSGN